MARIVKVTEGLRPQEKGYMVISGASQNLNSPKGSGIIFCAKDMEAMYYYFTEQLSPNYLITANEVEVQMVLGIYIGKSKQVDAFNVRHQKRIMMESINQPFDSRSGKIGGRLHNIRMGQIGNRVYGTAQALATPQGAAERLADKLRKQKFFFGFIKAKHERTERIFVEQKKITIIKTFKSGERIKPVDEWKTLCENNENLLNMVGGNYSVSKALFG